MFMPCWDVSGCCVVAERLTDEGPGGADSIPCSAGRLLSWGMPCKTLTRGILVLGGIFLLTPAAFGHGYVFQTHNIRIDGCVRTAAHKEMRQVLDQVNELKRNFASVIGHIGIDYKPTSTAFPSAGLETLFYARNRSLGAVAQAGLRAFDDARKEYCSNYEDETALNAVAHFATAATASFLAGDKAAKRMMDLHELNEYSFDPEGRPLSISVMDTFNNYMGLEAGREYVPRGDPQKFYLELGIKYLKEGKLRTLRGSTRPQVCLIPKDPNDTTKPTFEQLLEDPPTEKTLRHYNRYVLNESPLQREDWAKVIKMPEDPKSDPLYVEMQSYLADHGCCPQ